MHTDLPTLLRRSIGALIELEVMSFHSEEQAWIHSQSPMPARPAFVSRGSRQAGPAGAGNFCAPPSAPGYASPPRTVTPHPSETGLENAPQGPATDSSTEDRCCRGVSGSGSLRLPPSQKCPRGGALPCRKCASTSEEIPWASNPRPALNAPHDAFRLHFLAQNDAEIAAMRHCFGPMRRRITVIAKRYDESIS